jgi:uncharacterized repeat protein (TIGR01451 family)
MKKTLLSWFMVFSLNIICAQINITLDVTPATCSNNGIISITATGGTGVYQYSIDGATYQSSNVFSSLQVGTYTVTVIDSNNTMASQLIDIIQSNPLEVILSGTLDVPSSTLIAQVFGGNPPYTYQWSYNGVDIVGADTWGLYVLSLPPGVVCINVVDANGCIQNACQQIQGSQLNAQDDTINIISSNSIYTSAVSVLSNDTVNGYSITTPQNLANTTLTSIAAPSGFLLNADGTISVLPGISAGTYTISYQICYGSDANCDTANAIITIVDEGFVLNAYVDLNGNSIQDANEQNFSLGTFNYELNNSGVVNSIVSSTGNAILAESNTSNSYNFSLQIPTQYQAEYVCATTYTNVMISAGNVTILNFPVTQIPYVDLSVNLIPFNAPPRPGFTYKNLLFYTNLGNQNMTSGTITFNHDNTVSIVSTSEATTTTTNGFTYDFVNLLPNETRFILITMQVPTIPTVSLGQLVTNNASITIPSADVLVDNNASSLTQTIVGSYDPNDKSESHGGEIVHATFTSNDFLTYTIQFENTGTADAINVKVEDLLDSKLDSSTISMIASSADYTMTRIENQLTWNFNNINLPPSNGSSTTGHGYITFQIKPTAGYSVGDIIPNFAEIYFDFNPAIVTPVCNTEFVTALSNESFAFKGLNFYPNPIENEIYISNKTIIDKIQIYTINGQTIYDKKSDAFDLSIDFSSMNSGIYFAKIVSEGIEKTIKIIKK